MRLVAQKPWFENDQLFRTLLTQGHHWAGFVADYLTRAGLRVELTPMFWRDTIESRDRFTDEHDITVLGATKPIRIDVKSRTIPFTNNNDYPYHTAFIDTVSGWEAKTHKPSAVILVSQQTRAMVVVPVSTYNQWELISRRDNIREIEESFYALDRAKLASIDALTAWLQMKTGG